MIVSLDEIKRVLGIDLASTTEDENLTRLIGAATEWVQGQTHRRFDTPALVTEYRESPGRRMLYLAGHIDDSTAADNMSETADPTSSVHVFRRPLCEPYRAWEELIENEDWERRGDALVFLHWWAIWPQDLDGYAVAPADVQALVLELAMNQYLLDVASASGTAGITSEKLGDFSYAVDTTSAAGTTILSDRAKGTLNNRTRKLV